MDGEGPSLPKVERPKFDAGTTVGREGIASRDTRVLVTTITWEPHRTFLCVDDIQVSVDYHGHSRAYKH